MEAQLPILISEDMAFQAWFSHRYGASIPIQHSDLNRIHQIINLEKYPQLIQYLTEQRENIILQNHFPRLLEFYTRIYQG